jgi:hypothetical protein
VTRTELETFPGVSELETFANAGLETRGRATCLAVCDPLVLASKITNAANPFWDLRPYQGVIRPPIPCTARWRLIEMGECYPDFAHGWYGRGHVINGILVGLPDFFRSTYLYDGFMELQIGCPIQNAGRVVWPGTCQNESPDFPQGAAGLPPLPK